MQCFQTLYFKMYYFLTRNFQLSTCFVRLKKAFELFFENYILLFIY